MTVSADKVALRGFLDQASETSVECAEAEVLRCWVAVMELERLGARRVATVDTSPSIRRNEVELSFTAAFLERSPELLATSNAPCLYRPFSRSKTKRNLRSVVITEGRALEAKAAAVERADLSVYEDLRGELASAGSAHECLRGTHHSLPRLLERDERTAFEAAPAPTKVAPPAVDYDLNREMLPAAHANQHIPDRT
jgi:hypothetical protein